MIEKMIFKVKQCLPLKISTITWDGTVLNMYSENWSFTTLSAWRISAGDKVIYGCYDQDSAKLIEAIGDSQIIDIFTQEDKLKIDPVFLLSNNYRLEIFSTDTFEPWVFKSNSGFFVATPGEPDAFDSNLG